MRSWYVVYTHPREEALAEENLKRQGFEVYWPRYKKRASHAAPGPGGARRTRRRLRGCTSRR